MTVWRPVSCDVDDEREGGRGFGTSTPCVLCRRALLTFGVRVHCKTSDGGWFHGRLDEPGAPRSMPTSRQQRELFQSKEDTRK
jgi:hypothetical protein